MSTKLSFRELNRQFYGGKFCFTAKYMTCQAVSG